MNVKLINGAGLKRLWCAPKQLLVRTILSFAAHQSNFCCAPFCPLLRTRATFAAHHLLCCAPRGDSFPDVSSAIIAYPGKSLPAFFAVPKIYFPLIFLALVNIRDNLSRIFRDNGVLRTPLRKVCENDKITMLDSSVVEVCQRVSASEIACPVSIAEEGFCNYR